MFGKKKNSAQNAALIADDRRSILSPESNFFIREAYKTLRTNTMFALAGQDGCKVAVVTSSLQGEGKSMTALNLAISFAEAALGADVDVPTLVEGQTEKYHIPEGTQTGTTFCIKNRGVKHFRGRGYGNLYFKVNVETPTGLNETQKQKLREFAEACGPTNSGKKRGFMKWKK